MRSADGGTTTEGRPRPRRARGLGRAPARLHGRQVRQQDGPGPGQRETLSRTVRDRVSTERRAGLAPAFPRRKRGVFPWTTDASPTGGSPSDRHEVNSSVRMYGRRPAHRRAPAPGGPRRTTAPANPSARPAGPDARPRRTGIARRLAPGPRPGPRRSPGGPRGRLSAPHSGTTNPPSGGSGHVRVIPLAVPHPAYAVPITLPGPNRPGPRTRPILAKSPGRRAGRTAAAVAAPPAARRGGPAR